MTYEFQDWLELHSAVLVRRTKPLYIFILGSALALLVQFFYIRGVRSFHNHEMFKVLVEQNLDILSIGAWLVPVIVILIFASLSISIHRENVRKFHKKW